MDHNTQAQPAVIGWLQARQGDMLTLLESLVNSDSPSRDRAAVDQTGTLLKQFFEAHGIHVETEPHPEFGEAIHATLPDPSGRNVKPVVLLGHRDTVFPPGEAGRRPFRIEGTRAYGPGVADMKAGLVINAFVLAAFQATGEQPGPLAALITSDEEIASPSSRPVIERVARNARVVLNGEPGRASGNVVSGRKGSVFMRFTVTGRAAHSGGNFVEGRSAIGELAHKVIALHALTDLDRGITVNVGTISGGQGVNTVAPYATGEIDLRYVRAEDRACAGAGRRHHGCTHRARHDRRMGNRGRVPADGDVAGRANACSTFMWTSPPVRVSRLVPNSLADVRIAASRRRRARRRSVAWGQSAARHTPWRNIWKFLRSSRVRRLWPG